MIELLSKYVDDCTKVVEKFTVGILWDNNLKKLVHTIEQEKKEGESNITE